MVGIDEKLNEMAEVYGVKPEEVKATFRTYRDQGATEISAFKSTKRDLVNIYGMPEETPQINASVKQELNADDYLARVSKGDWISADSVSEGDKMTIMEGIYEDPDSYEKPYIIAPVKFEGEEYNLRLGVRNVRKLRDAFGPDIRKWPGREIEVVAIENYKIRGKDQKGLILRGVKESA